MSLYDRMSHEESLSPSVKLCPYCRSPKVYLWRKLYEYPKLFGFLEVAKPHASPQKAIIGIWFLRLFSVILTVFVFRNEMSAEFKTLIVLWDIYFFVTSLMIEPEIRKGHEKRYYKCRKCSSDWPDLPDFWRDVNASLKIATAPVSSDAKEPSSFHRLALLLFSSLSVLLVILWRWQRRR